MIDQAWSRDLYLHFPAKLNRILKYRTLDSTLYTLSSQPEAPSSGLSFEMGM